MTWHEQIDRSITCVDELKGIRLTEEEKQKLTRIVQRHPMRITPYYYSLINQEDPLDPIRKMAIPHITELDKRGTYDTSGEAHSTVLEGVQHKYRRTVLLLSNYRCAVYCRHCFRKRLVGLNEGEILKRVDDAVNYIKSHQEVNNILITGGDPLLLENDILGELLEKLSPLQHLDYIRIGSRIPVTLPQRILEDDEFMQILSNFCKVHKRLYVITHINHPRELTKQSINAIEKLQSIGIILSNQGVLLAGVNDDAAVLTELHRKLIRNGVQPYYMFQCRPVKGLRSSFQVPLVKGIQIIDEVRASLDGLGKRFRYIMSTYKGKYEIVGRVSDRIILKLHQSRNVHTYNKIVQLQVNDWGSWVNDFKVLR